MSLPASPANGARGGLAVAGADEGLEAGERRLGRILAGELHLLADLVADADGQLLERGLDGVGAIDALGDGGRQLLRLLLVGERLQQVGPARLLTDLLDGEIDAVVDDLVHADAAPLVADRGAIVDIGDAGLQGAHRDALDGRLEGGFVARLAGFVVGLGERLGKGRRDLSYGNGEGDEGGRSGDVRGRATRQCPSVRRRSRPAAALNHLITWTMGCRLRSQRDSAQRRRARFSGSGGGNAVARRSRRARHSAGGLSPRRITNSFT